MKSIQRFEMINSHPSEDEPHISLIRSQPIIKKFSCRNPKFRLYLYLLFIFLLILIILTALMETLYLKSKLSCEPFLLTKPINDMRSFYSYKLPNGLQTILIPDPQCVNPAGALSVNVGSKQEGDIKGLAHLLEHVLFMGSEKYPIEDYFSKKISLLSGETNAYTDAETTVYYWSIKQIQDLKQFDEILDIWGNFFIKPLINEEKVGREIYAVNSEYFNSLVNPEFRIHYLMSLMMNPLSADSQFACGNLESFRHANLTKELMDFYERFYVANEFNLVITGNYSLEQLKNKVENLFSSLKKSITENKNQMNSSVRPDSQGYWQGRLAKYQRKQGKEMVLSWILPELITKYRTNPLEYWLDLLNSEHKFGLIWHLKSSGLIESFKAVPYLFALDMTYFSISMRFSEQGFQEIDKIIESLMAYFELIAKGITKERWEELKNLRDLTFNYYKRQKSIDEISLLARHLRFIPKDEMRNLLQYTANVFMEYSFEEINGMKEFLKINKSLIFLGHEKYNNFTTENNNKSQNLSYFQQFSLRNYSNLYAMSWDFSEFYLSEFQRLIDSYKKNIKNYQFLTLPPENLFIPKNLSMPCKNPNFCEDSEVNEDLKNHPILIAEAKNHKIFYKMQRNFNKFDPKASIHIQIRSHLTFNSSKAVFLGHLARKWLKWHLKPLLQQLKSLDFITKTEYKPDFQLKIYGFVDKMELIAYEIGQIIKNCSEKEYIEKNPLIFSLIKNMTLQRLNNKMMRIPLKQSTEHLTILLSKHQYNYTEFEYLEDLQIEEFIVFFQEFVQKNYVNGLILGALDQEKALKIWMKLNSSGLNSLNPETLAHRQCLKLPKGKQTFYQLNNNIEDLSLGMFSYFQLGVNEIETMAKFLILLDFFHENAFDFLRNKAQLGYYAGIKPLFVHGIMGFGIFVQGLTENITIFEEKIEEFLDHFLVKIQNIEEKEFDLMKQSKIAYLLTISKLEDKENEYWEIIDGNFTRYWDIKEKIANLIGGIERNKVAEFWKELIEKRGDIGRVNLVVLPSKLKGEYEGKIGRYEQFKGSDIYDEVFERINSFDN